jgi:hypothetical protein
MSAARLLLRSPRSSSPLGFPDFCVRNCFRVGVGVAGQKYPYENGYRVERTVKNWLSGLYGPCGTNLVVLIRHSDEVLNALLTMARRQDLLLA